jgi:pyrimidine-nucleoside phosphorylase
MQIRPYDIISAKRDGRAHSRKEIDFLIEGYTRGTIPDYQVSAWLMACFLNGLNEEETFFLTDAMLHSGDIIDLSSIDKPKIDKHSTGGVGDKVSLVLAPAVAACGVAVPMTSGRGLGFTGGTLDKLESIPGFNVNLSEEEFVRILHEVGYAMIGQTENIAPADKKLYALRDVTGTVENISFITASILSKKAAEGAESIVMDVKSGSGAFMKSLEQSRELARSLRTVAEKLGMRITSVISSMDQPLGEAVGNTLEVIESISCLNGDGPEDLTELVTLLGGYMLLHGGVQRDLHEGRRMIERTLKNGEAMKRFVQSVRLQGGDERVIADPSRFSRATHTEEIVSERSGFVCAINTELIGKAAIFIGGGRFNKEESVDHAAGIVVKKKMGDRVERGDSLVLLHHNENHGIQRAAELIREAYMLDEKEPEPFRLIHEVIQ